jgi:hypothetical protein
MSLLLDAFLELVEQSLYCALLPIFIKEGKEDRYDIYVLVIHSFCTYVAPFASIQTNELDKCLQKTADISYFLSISLGLHVSYMSKLRFISLANIRQ